ncbi:MAG: SNF2-related protein [Saprospiraceae bacterium]
MQLFSTTATEQRHQLVYNLAPFGDKIVLPEAYLVAVSDTGELTYYLRKVQQNNVAAFGYPLTGTYAEIFQIIERLQIKNLEKKYNATLKRPLKLPQLLAELTIKKKILQYVDNQLSRFLELVQKSDTNLTWDGQKKVKLSDMEVPFADEVLRAHAAFKRTDDGMHYRLRLEDRNGVFRIRNQDIRVLTNEPAWILMNLKIYRIAHINGNMTKAFMGKNVVPVPERHIKTYFNFVRKVATKISIEAEGFEMVDENELQAAVLKLERNIFDKTFGIKLQWRYRGKDFHWQDTKAQTVAVDFGDGDDISIRKITRDFAREKAFLKTFASFKVKADTDNLFRPVSSGKPIDVTAWFIEKKSELEAAGFQVADIQIGDKRVVNDIPKISFNQTRGLDWLDIHGTVTVGKFTFKFLKLANYIRTEDPFFPLPDGTYFIIPQEWMTRYKGLVQFAKMKDDKLRIHKSQYGVLSEIEGLDAEKFIEKVDYQPSKFLKATLRPYQLEGIKWLVNHHENDYGALLADDMGLGKTLQTIALLLYAREQKAAENAGGEDIAVDLFNTVENHVPLQALIVLPTSLIYNWESEIKKFAPPLLTYHHVGPKRHKDPKLLRRFDVLLTTYQTALRDVELLQQGNWEYIILDES